MRIMMHGTTSLKKKKSSVISYIEPFSCFSFIISLVGHKYTTDPLAPFIGRFSRKLMHGKNFANTVVSFTTFFNSKTTRSYLIKNNLEGVFKYSKPKYDINILARLYMQHRQPVVIVQGSNNCVLKEHINT